MVPELILTPSSFVVAVNEALEAAYPAVIIVGELASFRVSKNRWVYFDLIDDSANVKFFGTVFNLPGPLEEGMLLRVLGIPRLSPRYGFSLTIQAIEYAGAGALKKASALLQAKLAAEGLFDSERKRPLPTRPVRVGLITSAESAAYADFIKISAERWSGLRIVLADVAVQGLEAPEQIVRAIEKLNSLREPVEVLVMTRGGGSAEDLQAFNSEQVTRAVATSRVPTLVAIGHEVDVSLAELAADVRASTPSNAAQLLLPDKQEYVHRLQELKTDLQKQIEEALLQSSSDLESLKDQLGLELDKSIESRQVHLDVLKRLLDSLSPHQVLKRGFALVRNHTDGLVIKSAGSVQSGQLLGVEMSDGGFNVRVDSKRGLQ